MTATFVCDWCGKPALDSTSVQLPKPKGMDKDSSMYLMLSFGRFHACSPCTAVLLRYAADRVEEAHGTHD